MRPLIWHLPMKLSKVLDNISAAPIRRQIVALVLVYAMVVTTCAAASGGMSLPSPVRRTEPTRVLQAEGHRVLPARGGASPTISINGKGPQARPLRTRPLLASLSRRIAGSMFFAATNTTENISTISSNFDGFSISAGSYIWFSSIINASGVPATGATVYVRRPTIQFTAGEQTYYITLPDAEIAYQPGISSASTIYDAAKNRWVITVPVDYSGNVFLGGIPYLLPVTMPGGFNRVAWTSTFYSDTQNLALSWKWEGQVYPTFTRDMRALGVKPVDGSAANAYNNNDKAGTPENFKQYVNGGSGGGAANYVGSPSMPAKSSTMLEQPPVANAGPARSVTVGTTVTLDGSQSSDPDGDPLTYTWALIKAPANSTAQLSDTTAVDPRITIDKFGTYVIQLIVNDGFLSSAPALVPISTINSPPVAVAGPDQKVTVGKPVQLDGSESYDVDGNPLTYDWVLKVPDGSLATLSDPSAVRPTFTPDMLGLYVAQLTVGDGQNTSSQPGITEVTSEDIAPFANAGPDQTGRVGTLITLDGTASYDADGQAITYKWSLISKPANSAAVLSDSISPQPTFTIDQPGTYVAQLIVSDGYLSSDPTSEHSTVKITTVNTAPVANAGPDQQVPVGTTVQLDGSKSTDVDGDPLTYRWAIIAPAGSAVQIQNPTSVNPAFTTIELGDYVIELTVDDGQGGQSTDIVTITSNDVPPVANPGKPQRFNVGDTVRLDGSASTSSIGLPLTYRWWMTPPPGSTAMPINADSANPSFVADVLGTYMIYLQVNDGYLDSSVATLVLAANNRPIADPGPPQSVKTGSTIQLDGSLSSDADDEPLTYRWAMLFHPAGSVSRLSDTTTVSPTINADASGTYVFQLIVNDGLLDSVPATVMIVASDPNQAPVVSAGPDQAGTYPDAVQLQGSATDDGLPTGAPLTIQWSQVSGPGNATFSDASNPTSLVSFDQPGTYVLKLSANDTALESSSTVTVTYSKHQNQPPVVSAGPDQAITLPTSSVTLSGTVTDDGLPNNTLMISWSQVSGPTPVSFSSTNTAATQVGFTMPGAYVLQLNATDTQYTTTSLVTVYVYAVGGQNQVPYVHAGSDQTIVLPAAAQLNGTAIDDGLPSGTLTIQWSMVSGPGTVTFANPASPVTTASFSMAGVYVLQLAATDSALLGTSNVTITVGKLDGHGGYKGTEFWLMFPMNNDNCPNGSCSVPPFQPQLIISSDVNNTGTVTIPGLTFSSNFTVAAGQATVVQIPLAAVMGTNDQVEKKGIRVTAQSEVTVVGFSYYPASADGYLGLPTPVLGTDYLVMGYPLSGAYGSEFGIVAPYDGTTVTITPTATFLGRQAGQPYSVVLNQGGTYEAISEPTTGQRDDLTGTRISSDKPIAVFSGNRCADVPDTPNIYRFCNHLVEQLPPTDLWGRNFLVFPQAGQPKGGQLRVLAAHDGTNVTIGGKPALTLNRGEFYETMLTSPLTVNADGPVLVAQFETGEEFQTGTPFGSEPPINFRGDPSMFLVPPYEQFGGHYTILTPAVGFRANYVNIVAPTAAAGEITMDGVPITAPFIVIPGSTYSGAQVPVSPGVHHFDGTAPFGVTFYGGDDDDAYSYQAGLAFDAARSGTTIRITPRTTITQQTGTQLCVTASLLDAFGDAPGGIGVAFTVTGANPSGQSVDSNSAGQAQYCYVGANSGTDTIVASIGSATDTATITWDSNNPNRAPVVYAGSDSVITLPLTANLYGVAGDDGLPLGGSLTTTWTVRSGPGTVTFGNASNPVTTATFSSAGSYDLRLTANDSQLSSYADVNVTVNAAAANQSPVVTLPAELTINLPTAPTLAAVVSDDGLPAGAKLLLQWLQVSGPSNASVVFSNPTSAATQVTFPSPGTYVLSLTADDSQLRTTANITISVLAQNLPPSVTCLNYGFSTQLPNATVALNCTVKDDGLPPGATVTQTWTLVTGPAAVTFSAPTSASTQASFTVAGSYTLSLAASDAQLTRTVNMAVNVVPANLPPVVTVTNSYQTITLPTNAATLSATVTDDGQPGDGTLTQVWNQTSGPAAAAIAAPTQASTPVTFTTAGTYNFQITASDSQLTTTQAATVVVNPANKAPVVFAGPDQTISLPSTTLTLNGTVSDDGLPAGANVTSNWSELSGPAAVTFSSPTTPVTQATFTTAGTYVLQLSANDTQLTSTSNVTITVYPAPQNQPPVVSAGPNQSITAGRTLYLAGSATDDGLPAGSHLTVAWTQLSGPATANISAPMSSSTYFVASVAGSYVLQLSANDTQLTSTATVTITVLPPINQPPTVDAGSYGPITLPANSVSMNGQVTDDGLPNGTLAISWSQVNGPAAVMFTNANQANAQVIFAVAGTYQLRLTADDSQLTAYRDTYITVNPADQAPAVTITPGSLSLTLPNNSAGLTVNIKGGTGPFTQTWSLASGPGPVTFSDPSALTTQVTFPLAGYYSLLCTVTDGQLTAIATTAVNVLTAVQAPPQVSINTPQEDSLITTPVAVLGSINSPGGDPGQSWTVQISLNSQDGASTQHWVTIHYGSQFPRLNATLATLDPSTLLNGIYTLRVTATDTRGQTGSATSTFMVGKNAKPGNFTLAFNDLSIPLAGLPITITRTYDSRDRELHDFGQGWSLGIASARIEKNRVLGKSWTETEIGGGAFHTFCLDSNGDRNVTITFADGKQYIFRAMSSPQCQAIVPIDTPNVSFVELPGSPGTAGATLVPADGGQALFDGPIPGPVNLVDYSGQYYNPTVFILTTREGYQYTIDQTLGVTKMSDPNGNTLTIGSGGIVSSTGKSITFTRNSNNCITKITDPNGNSLQYSYARTGINMQLYQFKDALNNSTTFNYVDPYWGTPFLISITDPRGITVATNQYDSYDSSGHLTKITDANNVSSTFTVSTTAQTEVVTDRLNHATTYAYDPDGNITSMTDALGNVTTYTYDANDNKLSETNALGKTTTYTYDSQNNRLSETDPLGNTTKYTYNPRGQVLTVTDPQGHVTTNVYDSNGNLTSTTDASGKSTSTVYGPNGLPSSVTDANGKITQFKYDGYGNLTEQTDALSNITTYTYDANGNKLTQSVTRTVNGSPQTLTTTYAYDGDNRVTKTTYPDGTFTQVQYNSIGKQSATIDRLNRTTTYAYDNLGRLTTTTYPDNTTETATYDAENHRLTSTDRAGHTTTYTYDADGRLTGTAYADNSSTQTNYDAAGRVSSTVDANGHTTTYGYDDAGRRTTITDALNHVTTFAYDAAGNQVSVQDANQNTTRYQYDALNRQVKVIYPDQTASTTAYDALGRVSSKTDQGGKTTAYGYDALGRLTSVTQDAGGLNLVTSHGYDELGNRISQTDANNHTTSFSYDQLGRRLSRMLPAGQSESYTYDAAGNLKTKTDFNGRVTTYAYDASNRLLSKTPDPAFNAAAITFAYYPNGLRKTMTDPSGTTSYTYDNRNRLTAKATPEGTLSYTYDQAGDVLTIASSNAKGTWLTYSYDNLNRLATVVDNRLVAQGAASGLTSYGYDAAGNLAGYTYPNGVQTSYTYNALNRLTQVGSVSSGAGALSSYTYTLGAAGNRLTVAELSGRTVNYAYDALYRLTTETIGGDPAGKNGSLGYTYDSVGNRATMTSTLNAIPAGLFSYDADDRLTTDQYDANGNTVSSTGIQNEYDFENHLIQHGDVAIVYDGDGNRVLKTAGGVTTQYLVDTVNPTGYAQVVDEIQNGAVTKSYSYGLERISQNWQPTTGNWQPAFYGYDGHGSVRFLTDAAGTVTDTYDYDAFGNLISSTGSTPNNYLFAGEQFDPDLNLYYNRARYLDVRVGRFWGMDSYEGSGRDPLSLHKYLYTKANPVNHLDPSGNEIDQLITSTAIGMTVDAISTLVFPQGPGAPAAQFVLNAFVPKSIWDTVKNGIPDAIGFGFSFVGTGRLGATPQLSGGFGLDYLFSGRTGNSAWYLSAGLFGAGGTPGVGVSGWGGLVFNAPMSDSFIGPFFNFAFPGRMLPKNLVAKVLAGAGAAYSAATAATNSPNAAIGGALALSGAFASVIDPNLFTADIFFSPTTPPTVGFAVMFGGTESSPHWQMGVTADIPLTNNVPF